jgi:ABC-2 type transport system ATP-binding protein
MYTLEIKNLRKYYNKGKVKAVDGISFNVPKGSRFGFLGPNGAGKTTTIRCILGLLNIDEGNISLFGEQINPKVDVKFRNRIGYLPGELGLYKQMTAEALIKYFAKLYDIEIDWNFVKEITDRLQIEMKRKMKVLSKGNKQKVGVLTALMGDFDLLIMDEPTSGLDPLMQSEFYKIVSERQKESNITVFVSSHVLPEVEKFCDKVAIIREGKIVEISDVSELKKKSLKRIELKFENKKSLDSFRGYLLSSYQEATIKYEFNENITFLLPHEKAKSLLSDISAQKWAGEEIRDFTITHSTLENIFMQYYNQKSKKEAAT